MSLCGLLKINGHFGVGSMLPKRKGKEKAGVELASGAEFDGDEVDWIDHHEDEDSDEAGDIGVAKEFEQKINRTDFIMRGRKRQRSSNSTEQTASSKYIKTSEASESSSRSAVPQGRLLKFLLSDAAVEFCRPDEETKEVEKHGKDILTYSCNLLGEFEELLCAVILSGPMSHMVGLRTIRTVLNEPYRFTSPKAIKEAGPDKVRRAICEAHTQHEEKTAEEIGYIVDAVYDNDWESCVEAVRKQTGKTPGKEREMLRSSIKGLGEIGLDIFYRRIQWWWEENYPFIDGQTKKALNDLGLPEDEKELEKLIEENWDGLGPVDGEKWEEQQKKRRAFVMALERAVGADSEQKVDVLLQKVRVAQGVDRLKIESLIS